MVHDIQLLDNITFIFYIHSHFYEIRTQSDVADKNKNISIYKMTDIYIYLEIPCTRTARQTSYAFVLFHLNFFINFLNFLNK